MNKYEIADLLKLLTDRNYTKESFSNALGVSRPTLDRYIEHPEEMKVKTLLKLCNLLNVPIEYVIMKQS